MILSIINGWDEAHFKAVAEKGLKGVEFCINYYNDSAAVLAQADAIKGYSQQYGVKVVSIGRWGMERLNENGEPIAEAMQHDRNLVDLAAVVGCPVYNVGMNRVEGLSYYDNCQKGIAYLADLIAYAEAKGVNIAMYNCDWANFVYEDKAWNIFLGALPTLGIKYDPSHCMNRKGNYLKEMRDWGSRFYHFHVKGHLHIDGDGYDDPPAGLDGIQWPAVMAVLYGENYNGALSIEPHSSRWKGAKGQWGIDYTIRYMSQFIMPEDYEYTENPYMP